jgi:hypothetical protein
VLETQIKKLLTSLKILLCKQNCKKNLLIGRSIHMEQKAKYTAPVCEVELFGNEDVLTASTAVAWKESWTNGGWGNNWTNELGGDEQ